MKYAQFLLAPFFSFLLMFFLSRKLINADYSYFVFLLTISGGIVQFIATPIAQCILKIRSVSPHEFVKENKIFSLLLIPALLFFVALLTNGYASHGEKQGFVSGYILFFFFVFLMLNRVLFGFIDLHASVFYRARCITFFEFLKLISFIAVVLVLYPTFADIDFLVILYFFMYALLSIYFIKKINKLDLSACSLSQHMHNSKSLYNDFFKLFVSNLCLWLFMSWDRIFAYRMLNQEDVSTYYYLSMIGTPISLLIAGMVSSLYAPAILSNSDSAEITSIIKKILVVSIAFAFAGAAILMLVGQDLLRFLFDDHTSNYKYELILIFFGSTSLILSNILSIALFRRGNLLPVILAAITIFIVMKSLSNITIENLSAAFASVSFFSTIFLLTIYKYSR